MYCYKCGAKIPYNSDFCPNCGEKIIISLSKIEVGAEEKDKEVQALTAEFREYSQDTAAKQEKTAEPAKSSFKKLLLWFLGFTVVGAIFFPGLLYYNIVECWGIFLCWIRGRKYWREREFIKVVAMVTAAIFIFVACALAKQYHKDTVRNMVRKGYSLELRLENSSPFLLS